MEKPIGYTEEQLEKIIIPKLCICKMNQEYIAEMMEDEGEPYDEDKAGDLLDRIELILKQNIEKLL